MKTKITSVSVVKQTRYFSPIRTILPVLISVISALSATAQSQKFSDVWKVDVGLTVAKPIWSFGSVNSFGIGIDASATRPASFLENLYVGARVNYTYYLAQKESSFIFATEKPVSLIGILGDAHYVYQGKYVVGGNLGVGIRIPEYFGTFGLARAGYLGYQLPANGRTFTLAVYLSRTTLATHVFGLRGSVRL